METGSLIQVLLWVGLGLSLVSETLRSSGNNALPIVGLNLVQLKDNALKSLVPALIVFVVVFLAQGNQSVILPTMFLVGFLLPLALSQVIHRPTIFGLILLGLSWLLPGIFAAQVGNLPNIYLAITGGFLLFGFIQSLISDQENSAQEKTTIDARAILPASLWLIGNAWVQTAVPETLNNLVLQSATASILILGAVFRLLPKTTNAAIENYVKPVALALASAGMFAILGEVLFHQAGLARWAILSVLAILAGGYFAMQSNINNETCFASKLTYLLILGGLTLIASRLFGTLGWVVAGLLISLSYLNKEVRPSSLWQVAALFLTGRSLLQLFIYDFNPNVTGINITHPYTSAAIFAGIVLVIAAREMHQHLPRAGSIALWVMLALGVSYYFHAEATGSLLVVALMTASTISILPLQFAGNTLNHVATLQSPTLVLLASWLVAFCALTAPWMEAGNSATKTMKLLFLIIPVVVGVILFWTQSKTAKTKPA